MIIEEYDESLFISRFEDYKRVETDETPNGNFSYKGLRYLFEYLDEMSNDTDTPLKLDVIALCCEFSEYKNLNEFLKDYSWSFEKEEEESEEHFKARMEEEINNETTLIKFEEDLNEGFIIAQF